MADALEPISLRSQFATLNVGRGKHRKYLPHVFTEQGASMLSAVLKSEKAVEVNIALMRAFVQFRRSNGNSSILAQKVERIEGRLNEIEEKNARQSELVLDAIQELKASLSSPMSKKPAPKALPSGDAVASFQKGSLKSRNVTDEYCASGIGKLHRQEIEKICGAVASYNALGHSLFGQVFAHTSNDSS